jgi:N-acyl-D-aspartate/D-glutamate deacylase
MTPLLLTGGTVVDGTGGPAFVADILVQDGRIRLNPPPAAAAERRDVTGLVVSPGFVDIHTHSDLTLLSDPRGLSKVHQGVTTEVVGNCGLGVGAPPHDDLRAAVSYLDLDPAVEWAWSDLTGYLRAVSDREPGLNVATFAGHLPLHATVCGYGDEPAGEAQIDRMCGLLRDALDAGAVGLSTGLVYAPLPYVHEDELLALAGVVAATGKLFAWHVRNYDDGLIESVAQAVRVARATGCRTQISHLAAIGRRNWGKVRAALDLVEAAGADVGVDIYPYVHGNAPLSQLLPARAQEGGAGVWAVRLHDAAVRAAIRTAWRDRPTTWAEIAISRGPHEYEGRTVRELADEHGVSGDDLVLDLLAEHGAEVMMTAGGRSEDDLRAVLTHPATVVASDGQALDPAGVTGTGVPHPRSYGCFPRYLDRYGTDLPDAIRRCTAAPAARVGLTDRGVLRDGAPADVVVFDPGRLKDRATFPRPHQFADGIELVLVNGVPTVERGAHTGARGGEVLLKGNA